MDALKLGALAACLIAIASACGGDIEESREQPASAMNDGADSRDRDASKHGERRFHKRPRPGHGGKGGHGGTSCETPPDAGGAGVGGLAGAGGLSGGGGGGGLAGGGGTGGTAQCQASQCEACGFLGPYGCCKADGTCGCTWFPSYCF